MIKLYVLWCVPMAIVGWLVWTGHQESIAFDVYRAASQAWWARTPLYDLHTNVGFVYLPQAAIIDSPFALMSARVAQVAWRAAGWALYFSALWRLVAPMERRWLLLLSLLVIPPSIGSLANGQASVHLVALMLYTACDLRAARWWRVTAWLMIGLAVKPLMIVPLLLLWPLHRELWWRIPIGIATFLLLPFVTARTTYVVAQYSDAWAKLRLAENPGEIYEDFRGLMSCLGWRMPHGAYLAVRAAAALGALAGVWWARRRPWATLTLFVTATSYLTVFSPRTQPSTYILAAPFVALAAIYFFREGRRAPAWAAVFVLLCFCVSRRRGPEFAQIWLKPLATMAFYALFMWCQRSLSSFGKSVTT